MSAASDDSSGLSVPIASKGSKTNLENEELLHDNVNIVKAVNLEKRLGLVNCVALIAGTVIGSGIFVSPTGILKVSKSIGTSIFIWLGCGIMALWGALCYAELGSMLRKSGGEYVYIKTAFGSIVAFLFAWTSVLVIKPAVAAILSLIFADYLLRPFFIDCDIPLAAVKLVACLCLCK